jgi:hypothetical protein
MLTDIENKCQYKKCGRDSDIVYLGRGLCEKHWQKICNMLRKKAFKILNIKEIKSDHE